MISLTSGITKYNELVKYSKKESDTDTENKLLVTTGEKEGEGQWGKGVITRL